jgi:hypothetical protein
MVAAKDLMMAKLNGTVGDLIDALSEHPRNAPVKVRIKSNRSKDVGYLELEESSEIPGDEEGVPLHTVVIESK